ncbi:MarR family transcriptional regulator [Acidisoma sp. S159]|uniref:MarR family transcriptional regulator n=1 Tax=Acidisoma sp. S159 TaxID=1747225 RepID=UPI00131D18A8
MTLSVSQVAVSYMLDRLVTEGLVSRLPDPSDRRSSLVRLKTSGQALCGCLARAFEAPCVPLSTR